jgi:hypothetical protein
MTADRTKALQLAGEVASAARALVGGIDLNGWYIKPATVDSVGRLSEALRTALDAYDRHIIEMLRNPTAPKP